MFFVLVINNGLLAQFGITAGGEANITFPISFTNTFYNVQYSFTGAKKGDGYIYARTQNKISTGITIICYSGNYNKITENFDWFSIGS